MDRLVQFKCDSALKEQAERIAKQKDETVSQVLRRALRKYVVQAARSKTEAAAETAE